MSSFPGAMWRDPGGDVPIEGPHAAWACEHEVPAGSRQLSVNGTNWTRCPDCLTVWVVYQDEPTKQWWAKPVVVGAGQK